MTVKLLSRPEPLRELFPELVAPLKEALLYCERVEGRELGLAETVDDLDVHGFCGCGDQFCGTFYTARPPQDRRGWTVSTKGPLDHVSPFTAIDLVGGEIVEVEIICADAPSMAGFKQRYDEALERAIP
jgi:hypothetical protein